MWLSSQLKALEHMHREELQRLETEVKGCVPCSSWFALCCEFHIFAAPNVVHVYMYADRRNSLQSLFHTQTADMQAEYQHRLAEMERENEALRSQLALSQLPQETEGTQSECSQCERIATRLEVGGALSPCA
jgi:hypothetical protein